MITTHQFDLLIGENDSSFVITKAKVASRFVEELYHPNRFTIPIDIDLNFNSNDIPKDAKDMFYRLMDKENNNKKIYILYRNPKNRFISGTIEDLVNSIADTNYSEKFFLRRYLRQHHIEPYELYKRLEENVHNRNFLLEDKFKFFLTDLLSDWFFWQISTTPVTSHHTSPYLAIYDKILKSPNINSSNVMFINIDDKENDLGNILGGENIEDRKGAEEVRKLQSNKTFYEFLNLMIEKNQFFEDLMMNVIGMDLYFYNEFENSENNIKNKK